MCSSVAEEDPGSERVGLRQGLLQRFLRGGKPASVRASLPADINPARAPLNTSLPPAGPHRPVQHGPAGQRAALAAAEGAERGRPPPPPGPPRLHQTLLAALLPQNRRLLPRQSGFPQIICHQEPEPWNLSRSGQG